MEGAVSRIHRSRELTWLAICLFLCIGCSPEVSDETPTPVKELADSNTDSTPTSIDENQSMSIFGSWKPTSVVMGGNPFDQEFVNKMSLVLTEEEYLVEVDGEPDRGTCTIDASSEPPRMEIVGTEGPNAGKTFLAIYDVTEAGELRIAYDLTGTAYPNSFESTADNGLFVATYARSQPEE